MKATTHIIPPEGDNILIDELYTPVGSVFIGKVKYTQYRIEDEVYWNKIVRTIFLEL